MFISVPTCRLSTLGSKLGNSPPNCTVCSAIRHENERGDRILRKIFWQKRLYRFPEVATGKCADSRYDRIVNQSGNIVKDRFQPGPLGASYFRQLTAGLIRHYRGLVCFYFTVRCQGVCWQREPVGVRIV